jgi:hypothetical protein
LKRNRKFIDFRQKNHNPSSRAPYHHKCKQLWTKFCIKIICQSRHTHCHFNTISDKIYMTNKIGFWNIPLIDSNTHEYAMVVLSRLWQCQRELHPCPATFIFMTENKFKVLAFILFYFRIICNDSSCRPKSSFHWGLTVPRPFANSTTTTRTSYVSNILVQAYVSTYLCCIWHKIMTLRPVFTFFQIRVVCKLFRFSTCYLFLQPATVSLTITSHLSPGAPSKQQINFRQNYFVAE